MDTSATTRLSARLYSADFDSVHQRSRADGTDAPASGDAPADPESRFLGHLRMATLLSRTVVLTDAQVLDGRLMQTLGPQLLLAELGVVGPGPLARSLPFEVRARSTTLETSLVEFFRSPTDDPTTLQGFEFSSLDLPRAKRAEVRDAIAGTWSVDELNRQVREQGAANAVGDLIEAAGAPAAEATRLRISWQAWIDAEQGGLVRVKPWSGKAAVRSSLVLDARRIEAQLRTPEGRETMELLLDRESLTRSAARALLEARLPPTHPDHETLSAWFDLSYWRAIASHHEAELIRFDSPSARPSGAGPPTPRVDDRSTLIRLDPRVFEELAHLPGPLFDELRYRCRHGRRTWWDQGDRRGLEVIAYSVREATRPDDPWQLLRVTLARFVAILVTGLIVALWPDPPLWAYAAATVLAVAVSSGDLLFRLFDVRRHRLAAVIDVPQR